MIISPKITASPLKPHKTGCGHNLGANNLEVKNIEAELAIRQP